MTGSRTSLSKNIINYCLYFNDITYKLFELLFIGKRMLLETQEESSDEEKSSFEQLINNLFKFSLELGKKTGTNYSLREPIKSLSIWESSQFFKSDIRSALWIVFGCKFNISDMDSINTILKVNSNTKIKLNIVDDRIIFNGPWSVVIPSNNLSFNLNCFTTSELNLAYKIAISYESKRGIIVYGPSPSGKSYTIRKLAELYKKVLVPVPLNSESTSDMLIGHYELKVNSEDNCSNNDNDNDSKGELVFRNGPLLSAIIEGSWVMIEDVNTASSDILERLNSLCEERPELTLTESGEKITYSCDSENEKYRIHPDFRIFFLFTTDNISLIPAPLLSRCIVLYANSLSTIESCQELCRNSGKLNEAQYFGEKSNVDFRKALRYLNNPNEQNYIEEYGCERIGGNELVIDLEVEKTNAEIFIEKIKAFYKGDDLVGLIEKVINESILYFNERNKQQLRNWLNKNVSHMLCYPINLILKTLDKHLDENSTILNPIYDTYADFERWLLFKQFKLLPTEKCKGLRISPLIDENPAKKLNEYFYADTSQIILLHYIIGREDLLWNIHPYGYYKPTIEKIFSEMKDYLLKEVDIMKMLNCMFERIDDINRYIEQGTLNINDVNYNSLVAFNHQLQSENLTYSFCKYPQMKEKIKAFDNFFNEASKSLSRDSNDNREKDDEKMNEKEAQDILKDLDPELFSKFEECFKGTGIKSELLDTIKKYEKLPSLKIKYENIEDDNTRLYIQLSHIIYFITTYDKATIPSLVIRYLSVFEKIQIKTKPLIENMYKIEENKNSFICYINSVMNKIAPLVYLPVKVIETIRYYPIYIHKFIEENILRDSLKSLYENGFLGNYVLTPDLLLKGLYSLCDNMKYNYIKIDFLSKKVIEMTESDGDVNDISRVWRLDYLRALKPYHFSASNEPGTLVQPSDFQYEYDMITYDSKIKDKEMYIIYDIIFKSKLHLNDKLILLSPKYETPVTDVILELLSDNNLKDYLLNEFNNVETIDEIVPSIDKYLRSKYDELNHGISKKLDELKKEYMTINNQNVTLVKEREESIKELNKKVKSIMEEKKSGIIANKESQKRIEMMKWVFTLVYHKSVNNYINSKKSKYPDEVIDFDNEKLLDKPSYPCFKIAFFRSDNEEISFQFKLNSPDSKVLSLDTKVVCKSAKSKDDDKKYLLPFVLPLSNLDIEIIPLSHMVVSYKYYPLKINEDDDVLSKILLSKMIENCHKNNVNFRIDEKNINQYEKLDNYYQSADNFLQSIIPPSNKYPLFFNAQSKNEHSSPFPIKEFKENKVIYLSLDPVKPSYVEDDISQESINIFYQYLQMEKVQLDYYAKDNNDKYYCMDISCKDYVDRINGLHNKIEENNKRISEIHKQKLEIIEERKNIPDSPLCYSGKIFPPSEEELSNYNGGDSENIYKHIKLTNVILITNIEGYEILLPKNNTFVLPPLIKSRFEPVLTIPILNPTNSPITIKENDCKVSVSCDKLEVRFNALDDGEFVYSAKIIVGSTERTIKFKTQISDYDNLYFVNYPCYISNDNPKVLYYHEEKYHPKDIIVVHYTEDDIMKVSHHFGDRKPIIIGNGFSVMYNPDPVEKVKESTEFYMKRHSWVINNEKKELVENVITNIPNSIISINKRMEQLKSKSLSSYISCIHDIFLVGLSSKDDKEEEKYHSYIFSVLKYIEDNKENYLNSVYEIIERNIEYMKSEFSELKWERKYQFGDDDTKLVPQFVQQASHMSNLQTIEISNPKSSGKKGIKLYRSIRDSELNKIANLYVDPITVVSLKHQKIIPEDSEVKTKEIQNRIDMTRNEIRSANVRDVLQNFKEYPLDIYFEGILTRINDNEACAIVSLKNKKDMEKVEKYHSTNSDYNMKIEEIRKILMNYSYDICCGIRNNENRMNEYVKLVTIVIDTSFTHKKYKARLRSLTACLLLIICEEFHIKSRIIASLSHGQAIQISNEDDSLIEKMCEIFDLESIEKMPSTPLDIFAFSNTVKCTEDRSNSYFIISDCFSEQLMSECNEVHQFVKEILPSIFLFHIVSNNARKDESISKSNIKTMNSKLEYNFPRSHRMIISCLEDFTKTSDMKNIYPLFYSNIKMNRVRSDGGIYFPFPSNKDSYGNIDIPDIKDDNYTVIIDNTQNINGNIPLPIVNDSDLEYILRGGSLSLYRYINERIKSGVLFNSLNASVIIPNKPTTWIPSISGTSIHFQNFIKFLLTKSGDGKIFKKKTGNKVRSYTISIVLDASTVTLSPINISHTMFSFFTLLRGVCELNVPAIDIWIATDRINKIGAGMISSDAWSSGVASTINTIIELVNQYNIQNTVLFETMQSAVSTCVARPYTPIMFVLTNYLTMEETRSDIKKLIYSSECKTIGVGVGYSIGDVSNIFPSFIWSSNPDNLYKSIASINTETPHQYTKSSLSFSNKKQNIENRNIEIINPRFVKRLSDIYSAFEYRALFVNTLQTKDENIMKLTAECTSSDYDLGKDGAFSEFNILFVILYLCRNLTEKDGSLVDEYITADVLSRVYDYFNATVEISSGKYRTVIITCSDGGGLPNEAKYKEFGYITQFIDCLKEYHNNGGGILWMLENHPYSYEANLFFKKVFNINELTFDENVEGGRRMERDEIVKPGKFRTVGQDMFEYNIDSIRIDTGLKYIYEGRTLASLNEKELEKNGFVVFAREHEGHSAIMLKEREEGKGKIVIDTASSKLFLEFTSDGTSRWISNAVIWLLNIDTYFSCNNFSGEVPKTIPMKFKPDINRIDKTMIPISNIIHSKPVNFCLTVIMDCTGTMKPYVEATKLEIGNIFNEVEKIKKENRLDAKSNVLLQFVGYKDFSDKIRYYESDLQPNFIKIKKLLSKVVADGGKDYCEDVSGGVETAIKHLESIKHYKHLIIIIGDEPNHGDGVGDDYKITHPETKETWDEVWKRIAIKLKELDADVHFMPVNTNHILNTMKRLNKFYTKVYSHTLTDFKSGTFTPLLKNVISVQYKQYIGIS